MGDNTHADLWESAGSLICPVQLQNLIFSSFSRFFVLFGDLNSQIFLSKFTPISQDDPLLVSGLFCQLKLSIGGQQNLEVLSWVSNLSAEKRAEPHSCQK